MLSHGLPRSVASTTLMLPVIIDSEGSSECKIQLSEPLLNYMDLHYITCTSFQK